jgi:hypothetical protein
MKLYHFTSEEALPSILEAGGLTRGRIFPHTVVDPTPERPDGETIINLTTLSEPVLGGRRIYGLMPHRPADCDEPWCRHTDRTRVRITVNVPKDDRRLVPLRPIALQIDPEFERRYAERIAAGTIPERELDTVWLFRGILRTKFFREIRSSSAALGAVCAALLSQCHQRPRLTDISNAA